MRRILLAFVGVFLSMSTFAQNAGHPARVSPFVRGLLKAQYASMNPAAKTTAVKQRLTGRVEYDGTGTIVDSFSVSYRGLNGSAFNAEFMDYGQWMGPGFQGFADMIFGYNGDGRFYGRNMGPDMLSDTIRQYSYLSVPPYAYGHFADQYHQYDANNNLLDEFWMGDASMGGNSEEYVLRYNSTSNIIRATHLTGHGTTVDTLEVAFFIYNAAGQMIQDSICQYNSVSGIYEPKSKYDYSYDPAGNMIMGQSWEWSGCWLPLKSYKMTYYPVTNRLKTCVIDTLFTAGLPETLDSFGYTTGVNYTTYSKHVDYTMAGTPQVFEQMRHVGPTGLPDTIRAYDRSLGNHYRYVYAYNTFHNPVWMTEYDSNASVTFVNTMMTFFYYDAYEIAGVSNATSRASLTLYPNPASNTLYLTHGSIDNKPVTIRICNQAGAIVRAETLYRNIKTQEISLYGLMPGTYVVYVECEGVAEAQQIIKL